MRIVLISFVIAFSLIAISCKKDKGFTKNHLDFSEDTLLFDTVFTTVGSVTKRFKVYNNNASPILIDEIELMENEHHSETEDAVNNSAPSDLDDEELEK